MFPRPFLLAATVASSLLLTSPTWAQAPDEAGVREALNHYLAGHAKGDPAEFRAAFHDDFKMFLMRDGKVVQLTDDQYIAGVSGKPADDEARRKRSIDFVSVTGDTAVARITLDYPGVLVTDYMSLLKTADGWKVVNKLVHAEQRPKT